MYSPEYEKIIAEDLADICQEEVAWEQLAGKRVLVSGASGFIGNYIVRTLAHLNNSTRLNEPVQICAVVRDKQKLFNIMPHAEQDQHISILEWDLNKPQDTDTELFDYVIHAASNASPRFYGTDPLGTILPNVTGTLSLLNLMKTGQKQTGFLFISSSEVYGKPQQSEQLFTETCFGSLDPMQVRSCYAEGKRMGETLCVSAAHSWDIPVYVARPFHTYGPGLSENDGRVFADFCYNVAKNENIVMRSSGLSRRCFCYISDAIKGLFRILLKGKPNTAYNLANTDAELSIAELADLTIGLFPEKGLKLVIENEDRGQNYLNSTVDRLLPDITKLKELGWTPSVSPAEGFNRTIRSLL